ncbi:MAG TPA: TIR domain-containing protein [Thermoanaerobaculia bacterium]
MTAPVFLSYHTPDREAVRQVRAALERRGIPTFLDREDLGAGRSWIRALENVIERDSRAAVVFVGPRGLGPWQADELGLALLRSKREEEEGFPVVPVLLPGGTLSGFLNTRHFIDLRGGLDDDAALDRLARAIRVEEPDFTAEAVGDEEIAALHEQGRRWRRRRRRWAAAAALLALLVLVMGWASLHLLRGRTMLIRARSTPDPREQLRLAMGALESAPAAAGDVARQALARLPVPVTSLVHGEGGHLFAIAFRPDGQRLATAPYEGGARLWQIPGGRPLAALRHEGRVTAIAFSGDRRRLATADESGRIRLWDADQGAPLRRDPLCCQGRGIRALAFSPDSAWLAAAGDDGDVCLWDPEAGERRRCLPHSRPVVAVAFSRDGRLLLTRTREASALPRAEIESVCVWALGGDRENECVPPRETEINDAVLSPTEPLFATAGEDGTVELWDLRGGGHSPHRLFRGRHPVSAVAFSPDGRHLAAVGLDGTGKVWKRNESSGWQEISVAGRSQTRPIARLAFSPDGRSFATSDDTVAKLWATATGREIVRIEHRHVIGLAFSPDGRYLATAGFDGSVRVWDAPGATWMGPFLRELPIADLAISADGCYMALATAAAVELRTAAAPTTRGCPAAGRWLPAAALATPASAVAFHPGGFQVAAIGPERILRWSLPGAEPRAGLGHDGATALAYSNDGAYLAVGERGGAVRVWALEDDQERDLLSHEGAAVYGMAFHPIRFALLATVAGDARLRLWRVGSGAAPEAGQPGGVLRAVAWSPDGRYLAVGGDMGRVWLWRFDGGDPRLSQGPARALELEGVVVDLAFSPDGRLLAAAGDNQSRGCARVWDVASGREIADVPYSDAVTALAWTSDGRYLAVASRDRSVRLWPIDKSALIEEARSRAVSIPGIPG